jgi:hypothetical protein
MEKDNLLYLIELNNNIIGTYDNLHDAETYILGCFQNNFFKSAKIKVFKKNSCYSIDTKIYSSNNSITLVNKPTTNDKILIWGLINKNGIYHLTAQIITDDNQYYSFGFGYGTGFNSNDDPIINSKKSSRLILLELKQR